MAACLKLGSKPDTFVRKGQAWFCTSGLPSDITVEVQGITFHLHKFPLVARSGKIAKLVEESLSIQLEDDQILCLNLSDVPGGSDTFELAAKFCYGFRLELTASNVVPARCAAEHLVMNEDLGEANLMAKSEEFLNQVVLRNWKECSRALHSCESVLEQAEDLGIVELCVDAVAMMACADPGWPMLHSPGGTLLWNGISTGAKPKKARCDWWYEDVSVLSLALFRRVIIAMEARGMKQESIAGALMHYAKRKIPALSNRRQQQAEGSSAAAPLKNQSTQKGVALKNQSTEKGESEQRVMVETIESLLPQSTQKGVVLTKFLSGLLRAAALLDASGECRRSIERRIGAQLEQASVEDLLMPNLSYNVETLYDTESVQRIVDHFITLDQSCGAASSVSPQSSFYDGVALMSPSGALTPMMAVARLLDTYLAEIASDVNLKPAKFLSLAESLPEYSRVSDDGIYRAIDIYLKAHPWLKEDEREHLCRIMDCQKLSLEACTHAAQNERLPLRVVVQVLFFEQLQLRTAIANCFMMSDTSRPFRTHSTTDGPSGILSGAIRTGDGWVHTGHHNHIDHSHHHQQHQHQQQQQQQHQNMKVDMDNIRLRVQDLERECSGMRNEIQKLGKIRGHWRIVSSIVGNKFKSQLCRAKSGGGGGGGGVVMQSHAPSPAPKTENLHFPV